MDTEYEKKICMSQCFNLAHAELIAENKNYETILSEIRTRTKTLYMVLTSIRNEIPQSDLGILKKVPEMVLPK